MNTRNDILFELQSISPLIAEVVPVNPYQIPEGYFDNLPALMVQLVKDEKPSEVLTNLQTPYRVPQNYFRDFPGQILAIVKDEKASLILQGASSNPYQVPYGYFENFASQIISRIKAQDNLSAKEELESLSPLLSKLDKKVPFSMPAGYFDDLSETVMAGTKAIEFVNEELENLSPVMTGLKTANVYTVPKEYFEDLPSVILAKAKLQQPARVVQMNFRKNVLKYAAAAIVTGIIIIGGLLFLNRQSSSVNPATIAQVEEKVQLETQNKVKELTDDELVSFIEDQSSPLPDFLNMTNTDIDSDDIKTMLADIPDAELKKYLDEFSDESESEVLTN